MYRTHPAETRINDLLTNCRNILYKDISIAQALTIPLWAFLVMRDNPGNFLKQLSRVLKTIITITKHFALGFFRPFSSSDAFSQKKIRDCKGRPIIVVIDHPGHVKQMALDLLEQFDKQEIIVLTFSKNIYQSIKEQFPYCICVYHPINMWQIKKMLVCYRYYKEIISFIDGSLFFYNLYLLPSICSIIHAIDYYTEFLKQLNISSVITMSDKHLNESVLTMVAKKSGIKTYTNQHGWFRILMRHIPVVSNKIFVWGSLCKEYLLDNGVSSHQIVISGNPKFDKLYSRYLPQKDIIRAKFKERYQLKPDQRVVTYLCSATSGTIPNNISFEFFRCFCQVLELPVNIIIKLRPSLSSKRVYESWLQELNINKGKVLFFQESDLFEILSITDIAVSTLSTAGLESIGFGIPTIILNTVYGFDIKKSVMFAEDAIESKTKDEFRRTIIQLISEPEFYKAEVEKVKNNSKKYFINSDNFNTSAFVRNYIYKEANI